MKKLCTIQNACMRLTLGARRTSPISSLEAESNVPPLDMYMEYLSARSYVKVNFGPTDDVISHALLTKDSNYSAHNKSILTKYSADDVKRQPGPVCSVVLPWMRLVDRVVVSFPFEGITMEKFVAYTRKEFPNYYLLFTDGSKTSTNETSVAAGLYDPVRMHIESWKLHPGHTVVSAELYAIWRSLLYASMHTTGNCIIFSDSQTSLQMIVGKTKTYLSTVDKIRDLLYSLNKNRVLLLHWVKAHAGIEGNEKADEAANWGHACDSSVLFGLHREEHLCMLYVGFTSYWHESWKESCRVGGKGRFLRELKDQIQTESPVDTGDRKMDTVIFRLRVGHVGLNKHLYRINKSDTDQCPHCGDVETIKHFLLECDHYYDQREKLFVDIATIIRRPLINLTLKLVLGGDLFPLSVNRRIVEALSVYLRNTDRYEVM